MSNPSRPNLETSLDALETLVQRMESGDLTLEESLKAFEEGVRLSRQCQSELQQAEHKVRVLMEQTQQAQPQPFEDDPLNES